MQYIETKYLSPTNTKCSRIKATTSYGGDSVTVSWDYGINQEENHARAAMLLAKRLGWVGEYVCGGSENGCVFVNTSRAVVYNCEREAA